VNRRKRENEFKQKHNKFPGAGRLEIKRELPDSE